MDIPGRFRIATKTFFCKYSDCIILGFDLTNKNSFYQIKNHWCKETRKKCNINLMYLIGCKKDLYEKIEVDRNEAINLAKEYNLKYFEISNKDNIGIKKFVEDLGVELIKEDNIIIKYIE